MSTSCLPGQDARATRFGKFIVVIRHEVKNVFTLIKIKCFHMYDISFRIYGM